MKNIYVDFRNFWSIDYEFDLSINFIKHYFLMHNYLIKVNHKNPDIIFYSCNCWEKNAHCFPEGLDQIKSLKVLFTRENLKSSFFVKTYLPNINQFDFVLGFNNNPRKNQYKIPYYFVIGRLYQQSHDYKLINKNVPIDVDKKHKNICLISSNPEKLRKYLVAKFLHKKIVVDCPGKVCNNMPSIDLKLRLDHNYLDHNANKRLFLKDYFFNICPENSYSSGYTTEKLYHALISGCIPIYWGCEKLEDGFYNIEKILLIDKHKLNVESIIEQAVNLMHDKQQLNHYINMPSFGTNRMDIIHQQDVKIKTIFKNILDSA